MGKVEKRWTRRMAEVNVYEDAIHRTAKEGKVSAILGGTIEPRWCSVGTISSRQGHAPVSRQYYGRDTLMIESLTTFDVMDVAGESGTIVDE